MSGNSKSTLNLLRKKMAESAFWKKIKNILRWNILREKITGSAFRKKIKNTLRWSTLREKITESAFRKKIKNPIRWDVLRSKISESVFWKKAKVTFQKYFQKFMEKLDNIPDKYVGHIRNILVLIVAYGISSFLIYPEFKFYGFLKEIFSLLCAYGAIFCWFFNKIDNELPFRIAVGVTACVAPVLFMNNTVGVAVVSLSVIILCEFIIFEYLRGCRLFSNSIPVYVICENEREAEYAKEFAKDYKLLELVVLSDSKSSTYSSLRSVKDMEKWMKKINHMPFYPFPRRFLYFAQRVNLNNLEKLRKLSIEHSVPLFRVTQNVFNRQNMTTDLFGVSPISQEDFETIAIFPSDRTALATAFKGKRVWICYDGRGSVLDLICVMSIMSSIDLTVLCESEKLMMDAERELSEKCPRRNYTIKIADITSFDLQGTKPDVLFYNMPIKSCYSGEENLKEAVVKNVLDTKRLIDFAQSSKISQLFLLSGSGALSANNWIGATQRLGELYAQFADFQSKKADTKFKVIRLPDEMTIHSGIGGKIASSILHRGYVGTDFSNSQLANLCHREDLLTPLLKTISSLMKNNDTTSSVYTIAPPKEMNFDEIVEDVCNAFCLRKDKDVRIVHNGEFETMKLEDFVSISESMEKTAVAGILRTKFSCVKPGIYERIWTKDEISAMTTRELISAVFQSLNQKIKY